MNKLLTASLLTAGSLGLFSGAFVGFAHLRGVPAERLPLLGDLLERLERPAPAADGAPGGRDARPPSGAQHARLGLLDVFRIDSPLQAAELQDLARQLKHERTRAEQRQLQLDEREEGLDQRAEVLEEQFTALDELRDGLERWQLELEERQAELAADEAVRAEREAASWERMARLFEKGDADALARRLEAWTPQEAARLLSHLRPDRARELLEALSGEGWKDYWEAYRQALPEAGR